MLGDLLFFSESDAISRLIQWWTAGPYNHVAVDMGDGTCIGALTRGVARTVDRKPALRVSLPTTPRLQPALDWLIEQEREHASYSWASIASAVFPSWLPVHILFTQKHAYDCSDLVAQYLDRTGLIPLSELGGESTVITPNDLYRAVYIRGWKQETL